MKCGRLCGAALVSVIGLALTAAPTWAGEGKATTVTTAKSGGPKKCADATKVNDAVLTVDDMPTGYGELPPTDDPETAIRLGGGQVSSANVPAPIVARTSHKYQRGTGLFTPYVANTAIILAKVADGKSVMKAFREAAALSATWEQSRTDGTIAYTSTALSFPKTGDDTLAVRLTDKFRDAETGVESSDTTGDYIVWRTGPVVSVVYTSNADALTFVKRANDKVTKILVVCPKAPKSTTTTKR